MDISLIEAFDLLLRCAKSCKSVEQLDLTTSWIDDVINPVKMPDEKLDNVLDAREILIKALRVRLEEIKKEVDNLKVELITQTIHE